MISKTNKLLKPEEVSEFLQIPKTTLYKLCHCGEIPAMKIGKHWRFDRDRLIAWLDAQFESEEIESTSAAGHVGRDEFEAMQRAVEKLVAEDQ